MKSSFTKTIKAFFIENVRRCSGDVGSILGSVHGRGQNSLRHKHMKMVTNVLALLQKLGMVRSRHEALVVWSQNHEKIIWWLWLPFNRSYGRRVAEIRTPPFPSLVRSRHDDLVVWSQNLKKSFG